MDMEHSLEWKFMFVGKLVLASVVAAGIGYTGTWYVLSARAKAESVTVAVTPEVATSTSALTVPLSTTTPQRVINRLTVAGAVPQEGKFIAADLQAMKLVLYQDGTEVVSYPILTKGKEGSPYETPAGFYSVLSKETDHFNRKEQVHLPYSMQFYGNYFIHGWPYYVDGTRVNPNYSGGCIRLSTSDAEKVYAFAEKGTGVFVYDPAPSVSNIPLALSTLPQPSVSAAAYLVADIDTGDVYAEKRAEEPRPIASLTKLMTALVANETIMFNNKITMPRSSLSHATSVAGGAETFVVGDLLYPLLMESNNAVADTLAQYYGTAGFVNWMNTTAKALDMTSTHFADPSGISSQNISTPEDLYRLAVYLADKKSFIWSITRTPDKQVIASSGTAYRFNNFNIFFGSPDFIGGKVGQTVAAGNTMISVFSIPVVGVPRRVAVIVLKSDDYAIDTGRLTDWFTRAAEQGASLANTACATCALSEYRKIAQ